MAAEDVYQKLNSLFNSLTSDSKLEGFLQDVFNSFEHKEFTPMHKSPSKPGLVRARCMIQDSRGTEFVSMTCDLKKGEEVVKTSMILRDGFDDHEGELVSCDGTVGRHCYSMVEVPGATHWFIEDFAREEEIPEKRSCTETGPSFEGIPTIIAKFIGEACEDLKPNTIIDLFGLLSHHQLHLNNEDGCVTSATNSKGVPNLHVIKYQIVDAANYDDVKVPEGEMKCVRDVLKQKLVGLVGDETTAEFLLSNVLSSTYSRPGGMPICSIPVNIVGVQKADALVDFLKSILPKVKWLQLTPSLLSDVAFAPVKDYNTEQLVQGELQLADGTLLVIDETQLPEGSFPVAGHVEANLKVLEQLILEQRITYDYGFYKIPFDVDIPMLILSKKNSRILKTPCIVPYLPPLRNVDEALKVEDPAGMAIVRKYIQTVRMNLKKISITADTTKEIQNGFVELCRSVDKTTDKADLLNELLILSRVMAASVGSSTVELEHWKAAVASENARKEVVHEYSKTLQQ